MSAWWAMPPQCAVCGAERGPWCYPVNDEAVCAACAPAAERCNPAWAALRAALRAAA